MRGGPTNSLEYWNCFYPRLHYIISEDNGSMVGQASQDRDSQGTLHA